MLKDIKKKNKQKEDLNKHRKQYFLIHEQGTQYIFN